MSTAEVVLERVKEALGSPVQGQGRDEEAVWDIRTSAHGHGESVADFGAPGRLSS